MSLRILVVDDEAPARERLERLLAGLSDVELAGAAASGEEALRLADRLKPHVVLMDIRMPGMSGLEAARHLAEFPQPPAVIFTTAYEAHALEAFEVSAAGYLLKPIRADRLGEALERVRQPNRAQLSQIAEGGGRTRRTQIAARIRDELRLVPVDEVLCFVADQKYTVVRYAGGEVLIEEPLKSLEEEFAPEFLRVHRNALVAIAQVEAIERDGGGRASVRLRHDGGCIAISRRLVAEVTRRIRGG